MKPEREAEIRAVLNGDLSVDMDAALPIVSRAADDLLDEVERLRAKHERARADWKTTIKFRTTQRNEERAENARLRAVIEVTRQKVHDIDGGRSKESRAILAALLNPTEGEK